VDYWFLCTWCVLGSGSSGSGWFDPYMKGCRFYRSDKTSRQPQHPTPRQKWSLLSDLQNMQPFIRGSNQPQTEDTLPRTHQVHKNQQSTIGLRPTHLTKSTWVWYISWNNDPAQAHPTTEHVTPLRTVSRPIPPPSRQTDSGTMPKWPEPSFPTGLQSPTPYTPQNRASKPASC
jgi:hypothetical protein